MKRMWSWAKAAMAWTLRLGMVFVAVSVVQVGLVRWFDPPATATMLQRVAERAIEGKGIDWVAYEPVSFEALGRIPRAAVASEDGRFWFHHGFDWEGICLAAKSNAQGKRLRGGSTISQQAARNLFLVQHRSWIRKGLEVWYTALLELLVPKERILELYLNVAESGPHHFGFEAGARHWYKRSAKDVSRDQASRLVSLLPNPQNRVPTGSMGAEKAAWVQANAVPFPGDLGFERARAQWGATDGPLSCW